MAFTDPKKNLEPLSLQEGMKVVDIGAGSGFYTFEAAKAVGNGGKVYAIDVQPELLIKIKNTAQAQKLTNVEVIHGNIEIVGGTRLHDKSIDAAIISNTLFQIEHKEGLIAELKRILKSSSKVLVIDWTDSFGGLGPHPDHIVTPEKTKELFESQGFSNVQYLTPGDHHYGFIYRLS
jgi:ubiquinone/menaquinone biosynthesis C-methylase UbiE